MTVTRAVSACLLTVAVTTVAAQELVFRTGVDLVTVDAIVLGGDGRAVPNLGAEDFVVEVDGRPRKVVSAQFVAAPPQADRPAAPPASYYTSNEQSDAGRYIVIAVDEAHIRRLEGRAALRAAAEFLDTLDPADRIAVTGLSRVGVIEFTRDRAASKRRLATLTGHTDPVFLQFNLGLLEAVEVADGNRTRLADVVLRECGRALSEYTSIARLGDDAVGRDACPEHVEQEARGVAQHARTQARISLSALTAVVETLKALEGPKTVVLLSEGMVVDPRLVDLGQLASATRDARVAIYGLHMDTPLFEASQDRVSPTLLQDIQVRSDGLARLAGAARGAMFRLVGSDTRSFMRVAEEISSYYLLAVEPSESDRDGNVHRLDVKLRRGGGLIRARSAFRIAPVAPSPRMREEDLVALLRSARPAAELPVRVATFVYAEPASQELRVVVSTEADAAVGPAGDVLLGYVLIDANGLIVSSGAHRVSGGRRAFSARLSPGTYTLRVGGIDPFGRRGIVQRTFVAVVPTRNGVRVSDLILAHTSGEAHLPLDPIIDAVADSRLSSYVELYAPGAQPLPDFSVIFDIVAAGTTVPIVSQRGEVERLGERWAKARAVIPLDQLSAGKYVVIARLISGDREVTTAIRPFTRQ